MDPDDTYFSLHSSLKDAYFQDDSFLGDNLERFSKFELLQALKEAKNHNSDVECSNQKFKETIEDLTKSLNEQYERCLKLEKDKSFLRNNIKRASASWFERKVKLSESENECSSPEPSGAEGGDIPECETKKDRKDGAQNFIAEETVQLFVDLKYKEEQLHLSEQRCAELNKQIKDYEKVIDDQEVIIHGLEKQLDTYFNDNQKMSKQLTDLHRLFMDLEAINEKQVNASPPPEEPEASANEHLPTSEDFKEMSGSVAKTYTKLKELIYEKKSLVTEIERLRILNVELQNRVSQQELRLMNVSDALQTTWLLVSNMKDEHEKIHTTETILRYELKEKREILNRLKSELECSREQWQFIRQRNSETEQEWTNLREELNERRKLRKLAEMNGNHSITQEEIEGVAGTSKMSEIEFEPPIDLLVNMGIEYGVVNADDEESTTAVALVDGEDVHENRLQNLEEQCCFLYQKLMTSTARALTLASRLTSLHQHYAASDDEYEEDDENEEYFNDEGEDDEDNLYETQMLSPDSESHDTAYVSEAEGGDSTSGAPEADTIVNEGDSELTEIANEDSPDLTDDNADILSKRLINFLPKKIELLRANNEKLEEKLRFQQEEKLKTEATLSAAVEFERRQRRQLEQQLSHLGKCVDELKLERNGKIAKVEDELRKKIEQVDKEEKEHIQLRNEFENLKEKFEERGHLLQLTSSQLEQTTKEAEENFASLQEEIRNLRKEGILEKRQRNMPTSTQSSQTDLNLRETKELPAATDSTCETGEKDHQESLNPHLKSIMNGSKFVETTIDNDEENRMEADSQFKQLVILTKCCLRIPFILTPGSILCWSCYVAPQEIMFSICYDDAHNFTTYSSMKVDHRREREVQSAQPLPVLPNLLAQTSSTLNAIVTQSRILLEPILIGSSSMPTSGRIIPKVPGRYSLIFQNLSAATQEISLKLWLQRDSSDGDRVMK